MELLGNIPAYIQIKNYYKRLIETGAIKEGEYLPSVREVSLLIGVNPNTVQRAFTLLIDENLVTPIVGKGNRVNKIDSNGENLQLKNDINDLVKKGYSLDEIKNEIEKMMKEEKLKWLKSKI